MEEKYNGWIISDNFFKRAIAIFLYSTIGYMIIAIPFVILFIILTL